MGIQWRDVCVTVGTGRLGAPQKILSPCSGMLSNGHALCLMGPSGSGKTTFLNCLREAVDHQGEVRFNGMRVCPDLRQIIGFTEQEDVVVPLMKVKENLKFLADLRFGYGSPRAAEKVRAVLELAGLEEVVESYCRDITTGERKRFCIARELLADPLLLLCDEPFTGLDATAAHEVGNVIKRLCAAGKTSVIASIREPSTMILDLFNDIILLQAGEMIFSGPTPTVEDVFKLHGPPRPPSESLAEYLVDATSFEEAEPGSLSKATHQELVALVREQAAALPSFGLPAPFELEECRFDVPYGRQLLLLSVRFLLLSRRQALNKACLSVLLTGLALAAATFWQLSWGEQGAYERFAVCNLVAAHWALLATIRGVLQLSPDRELITKETRFGCYSLAAYYVACVWLTLPFDLLIVFLWTGCLFILADGSPFVATFFQFQLIACLSYTCYHGLGLCIAATRWDVRRAMSCALGLVSFSVAWSCFFADLGRLPAALSWLRYFNCYQHTVTALMRVLLFPPGKPNGLEFSCDKAGANVQHCTEEGTARVLTAEGALRRFQMHAGTEDCIPTCIAALVMAIAIFRVLVMYSLLRKKYHKTIEQARTLGMRPAMPDGLFADTELESLDANSDSWGSAWSPGPSPFAKNQWPESRRSARSPEARSVRSMHSPGCTDSHRSSASCDSQGIELALLRMGAPRPCLE